MKVIILLIFLCLFGCSGNEGQEAEVIVRSNYQKVELIDSYDGYDIYKRKVNGGWLYEYRRNNKFISQDSYSKGFRVVFVPDTIHLGNQ